MLEKTRKNLVYFVASIFILILVAASTYYIRNGNVEVSISTENLITDSLQTVVDSTGEIE